MYIFCSLLLIFLSDGIIDIVSCPLNHGNLQTLITVITFDLRDVPYFDPSSGMSSVWPFIANLAKLGSSVIFLLDFQIWQISVQLQCTYLLDVNLAAADFEN